MKNALSLACMLLAGILMPTTSFAQSNTLFNPDYNGDGFIGVDDILGALSFYDNAWEGSVSPSWTCGEAITYAGVGYSTVQIGDQCWFAENLRTTTYLNGDAIPQNLSDGDIGDWSNTTFGAMTFYNDGPAYGGLYNWYAVDDARGLCPSSWHVPTDAEWTILTDHLGGESVAGSQMKLNYAWFNGGNGTNSSGFSGLPGGLRSFNSGFDFAGDYGFWWSSSPNDSLAWSRDMYWSDENIVRDSYETRFGFSVRCVRDAEGIVCTSDADSDGICDDVDPCVGSPDACGVCNGPGAIYDCGCSGIPVGDCDCDGNQLDALGVCGGSCSADVDGDGICDDVDPGISVAISVCSSFTSASAEAWPVVLTATTIADGASSQEAQTLVINVTSLPAGAQYRVFKSIANGNYAIGNLQDLVLGQNTVTVPAVDFDREVQFQFSDGDVEFDFLSINGEELDGCYAVDVDPAQFQCGNVRPYRGYDYATVLIGDQCWFAENLRTTTYLNGEAIPQNLSDGAWSSTDSGAMAFPNLTAYGSYYNWFAVDDARGLCPSGWHVPTDAEWTILTDHLGGESLAGVQMKTNYGWNNDGNGTNSSGFSGLPGGFRDDYGYFGSAGSSGYWWSSSPNGSSAWYRSLSLNSESVYRGNYFPQSGFSVRCVRDAE